VEELAAQLRDGRRMEVLRASMWRQREQFAFDTHVPRLVDFFRQVMAQPGCGARGKGWTSATLQ
jgi:hypothetical protein